MRFKKIISNDFTHMSVQKLITLGCIETSLVTPLKPDLEKSYGISVLGISLYMACGGEPKYMKESTTESDT